MNVKVNAITKMREILKIVEKMQGLVGDVGFTPGCEDLYHQECLKIDQALANLHAEILGHETKVLGLCLPWVKESNALNYEASSEEGKTLVHRYACLVQKRDSQFRRDTISMVESQ